MTDISTDIRRVRTPGAARGDRDPGAHAVAAGAQPDDATVPSGPSGSTVPAMTGPEDRESLRRRALTRLAIVGTPREERFDRITRLARLIFGVPIANITLLDGDRFWLKASQGMPDADYYLREQSFCDTTARLERPLIVPDSLQDQRFATLPWTTADPPIRFYAGYPIADANGIVVGTLCLIDSEPRTMSHEQLGILAELAEWTRAELISSTETTRAREVQQGLLPRTVPALPGYQVAGLCLPAQSVGGDLYDWGVIGDGFAFTVSDVMGKGTGAAILSASVRSAVRSAVLRQARQEGSGGLVEVAEDAARTLYADLTETNTVVTAFLGHLSVSEHVVRWVDAGHGLALLVDAERRVHRLAGEDPPLGVIEGHAWTEHRTCMPAGSTLLVFSDGLFDLLGGDASAMDRIGRLVTGAADLTELMAQLRSLTSAGVAIDDVTAVALRRAAG